MRRRTCCAVVRAISALQMPYKITPRGLRGGGANAHFSLITRQKTKGIAIQPPSAGSGCRDSRNDCTCLRAEGSKSATARRPDEIQGRARQGWIEQAEIAITAEVYAAGGASPTGNRGRNDFDFAIVSGHGITPPVFRPAFSQSRLRVSFRARRLWRSNRQVAP